MKNTRYSFLGGVILTTLCIAIGVWANITISGDPLSVAETTNNLINSTTILLTTLFVGLSGGHYLGASFNEEAHGRWFALGANLVLWVVLVGFVGYQFRTGGSIIKPIIYGAVLLLSGGFLFVLHKSELVEDESRLDEYIELFSSKGTALVVTAVFIVRTIPNPMVAALAGLVIAAAALLLWNAYGDRIRNALTTFEEKVSELASEQDRQPDSEKEIE